MLNKIKIGPKLIGGFAFVALIALCFGIYGVSNIKTLDKSDTKLYVNGLQPFNYLIPMTADFQRTRINLRDMVRATSEDKHQYYLSRYEMLLDSLKIAGQEYEKTLITDSGKAKFSEFKSALENYSVLGKVVESYAKAGKRDSAFICIDGKFKDASDKLQTVIFEIASQKIHMGSEIADNNTNQASAAVIAMIITMVIGVLISLLIGISLTVSITKPLTQGVSMMQEMSKGHLGTRLHMNRSDEIGILANAMDTFADDLQKTVVGTMQKISNGDLSSEISIKDNQDEINPALKRTIDALHGLVSEAAMLCQASIEGKLQTRGNANNFKGSYREIVDGVNKTLDAVINPVIEAANVLDKVSARDLTARVVGDYKGDHARIKNSLNLAVENLDKALQQVSEATEQVTSASQQISSGSQSLAQGANEQASSLEEVSSSLEEMASMTKQNADNAIEAKNLSGEADQNANLGSEAMNRMTGAINRIKESSDQTAKIVKTIDEIAMQTNLLALNAAVEAARAGEAGRGFAVVAEEVRNLAQRSAQAAKNTADMISESVKNADDGVKIALEVSKSFESIATSAKKVNDLIAEIAAASQEQSQGIDQVNGAVAQMDKVTQQNAANSEESASAAEELSSQAEELKSMIDQFMLSYAASQRTSFSMQTEQRKEAIAQTKHMHVSDSKSSRKTAKKPVKKDDTVVLDDEILKEF